MKLTHTRPFSKDRRGPTEQDASQAVGYLIPLVDEVNQSLTLTCRYCGATTEPLEVAEDGDDYVVPLEPVFHLTSCPLLLAARRH